MIGSELEHAVPLQFRQAILHSLAYFLHVHDLLLQSDLQVHQMTFNNSCGAGGMSISMGKNLLSVLLHPQSQGSNTHCVFLHCCTCRYTLRLWNLAADDVGGRDDGSTWLSLTEILSMNFLCLNSLRDTSFFPL